MILVNKHNGSAIKVADEVGERLLSGGSWQKRTAPKSTSRAKSRKAAETNKEG